jgi:hypothetical protein
MIPMNIKTKSSIVEVDTCDIPLLVSNMMFRSIVCPSTHRR